MSDTKSDYQNELGSVDGQRVVFNHRFRQPESVSLEDIVSIRFDKNKNFLVVSIAFYLCFALLLWIIYQYISIDIGLLWVEGMVLCLFLVLVYNINQKLHYSIIVERSGGRTRLLLEKSKRKLALLFLMAIDQAIESKEADWSFLRGIKELAHYSVIQGYIDFFEKHGSILDVGCGEGILQEKLKRGGYEKYLGFDSDERLIESVKHKEDEKTTFRASSVEAFESDDKYDAIVLCEVLYYLKDPVSTFKTFKNHLKKDGVMIVSMFNETNYSKTWEKLDQHWKPLDTVSIENDQKTSWVCKCYQWS